MAESMRDKIARLEREVGALRQELEDQRYVNQCLLRAADSKDRAFGFQSKAMRALTEASQHHNAALAHLCRPSIPNN